MSGLEGTLPPPLREALDHLSIQRNTELRVDAIEGNFAYVWVAKIAKNDQSEAAGGWIRLPLPFPHANPHGFVTCDALKKVGNGIVTDAHNPNHEMCNPVAKLGGAHYYSWTWEGSPQLRQPTDIVGVVQWYERRIRKG